MDQLSELLKGGNENDFSSYNIASKAHLRWSKKEYLAAAVLFEAASRVAVLEYTSKKSDTNQFLNYISRSGVCYSQGGEFEKALPKLNESISSDWVKAGLEKDIHMVEWCYIEKLLHVKSNPIEFSTLFSKARERCEELGWCFPKIHPKQEALLEVAVNLKKNEIVLYTISLIKSRKPISRALRSRIKEIEVQFA